MDILGLGTTMTMRWICNKEGVNRIPALGSCNMGCMDTTMASSTKWYSILAEHSALESERVADSSSQTPTLHRSENRNTLSESDALKCSSQDERLAKPDQHPLAEPCARNPIHQYWATRNDLHNGAMMTDHPILASII